MKSDFERDSNAVQSWANAKARQEKRKERRQQQQQGAKK